MSDATKDIKTPRVSNLTPRVYSIMLLGETVATDFSNEAECREWIIKNGENDVSYNLAYSVQLITPIIKTAKITLK